MNTYGTKFIRLEEIMALDRNSIPELNRDIEFIDSIRHLIMDKNPDEALKYLDDWKDELIMKVDNTPLTHEEDGEGLPSPELIKTYENLHT